MSFAQEKFFGSSSESIIIFRPPNGHFAIIFWVSEFLSTAFVGKSILAIIHWQLKILYSILEKASHNFILFSKVFLKWSNNVSSLKCLYEYDFSKRMINTGSLKCRQILYSFIPSNCLVLSAIINALNIRKLWL